MRQALPDHLDRLGQRVPRVNLGRLDSLALQDHRAPRVPLDRRVRLGTPGSPGPPNVAIVGGTVGASVGLAGLEYVRQQIYWPAEPTTETVSFGVAKAPDGKVVIAGGFEATSIPGPHVLRSSISDEGDGWQVVMARQGELHGPTQWFVWAICAKKA